MKNCLYCEEKHILRSLQLFFIYIYIMNIEIAINFEA